MLDIEIYEVTLHFQLSKIGQISNANIETKNLTLFIGKNGSGKTYATSSIWSLINFVRYTAPKKEVIQTTLFDQWKEHLSIIANTGGTAHFEFNSIDQKNVESRVLESYHRNKKTILAEAIGYDGFGSSRVACSKIDRNEDLLIACRVEKVKHTIEIDEQENDDWQAHVDIDVNPDFLPPEFEFSVHLEFTVNGKKFYNWSAENIPQELLTDVANDKVTSFLIGFSCFGREWNDFENTVYIPAARTGIMLALDYFVQGAIDRGTTNYLSHAARNRAYVSANLPAPIQAFASSMMRNPFLTVSRQPIELTNILGGRIGRGRTRGTFSFRPSDSEISIPLASSSSLVTELSALSIVSRQMRRGMFLIFEEPEAHLHLEAQREMAKYIAVLINSGVKVLITTHSDTFIQQINNLIVLSDHPKQEDLLEQLSLNKNELILRDDVVGYDFTRDADGTTVNQLTLTKTGFVANSLNETLEKLYLETIKINDELD